MSEMNWTDDTRTRATLDRPAVDDKRAIERPQPAAASDGMRLRLRDHLQHATEAARGRVAQAPLAATAMAAAGGAALTALAMLLGARMQPRRSPARAGLRRIRAAIR